MSELEKLNQEEKNSLLKIPAYVTLLAAAPHGELDEAEKKAVIKLSHIKTYSCHPMLREYYAEEEKVFKLNMELLNDQLPHNTTEREWIIKKELAKLEPLFAKLEKDYSATLHRSFISFVDCVSRAHRSALYSIFPFPIRDITT